MCVLALAWQAHPKWRLVLAGNRDEHHARPTAPLAPWDGPAGVIAGRDLAAGGTWLGVAEQGRFAVVTNLRGFGPPLPDTESRGALVADVLAGSGTHADLQHVDLTRFSPFNLILVEPDRAQYLTNQPEPTQANLAHGIYGLSNGMLDEPWPKTLQLKAALFDWLMLGIDDPEPLFAALASRTVPDFGVQPGAASDVPQEPRLSSIFIHDAAYGTRCSTVVLIDVGGEGRIIERRFSSDGIVEGEDMFAFRWQA